MNPVRNPLYVFRDQLKLKLLDSFKADPTALKLCMLAACLCNGFETVQTVLDWDGGFKMLLNICMYMYMYVLILCTCCMSGIALYSVYYVQTTWKTVSMLYI